MKVPRRRLRRDKTEVLKPKSFIARELNPSRETDGGKREEGTKSEKFKRERSKVTQVGNLLVEDFDFTKGMIGRIPRKEEVTGSSPAEDKDSFRRFLFSIFPVVSLDGVYPKKGSEVHLTTKGMTAGETLESFLYEFSKEKKEKNGSKIRA